MKVGVRDSETLMALKPLEVLSYLRATGWKKVNELTGKWSAWTMAQDPQFEVVVPLTKEYRDFALRMSDMLRTLEVAEERSQLLILQDLFLTFADIVRPRIADRELAEGTIPLEEGAQFVQKAKDMMLAAACAAVEKRPYFPGRRPVKAIEYLRKTRLGQTEHGSFVLTIISRVPPSLERTNGELFEKEEPFERLVTQTLAHSLIALRNAVEEAASTGKIDSFVAATSKGVSANLCDALVGMGTAPEANRLLEIGFSWSRNRPLDEHLNIPSVISFPPDVFPVIQEAADYFKETTPRAEFEISGPVVKLKRLADASVGKATVHCFIDEQPRMVTLELSDEDYHKAVAAHDEGLMVRCSGKLIRQGRSFELRDLFGFTLEPDE